MKLKKGFILKKIRGSFYAVPVVKNPVLGDAMVKLNETGYFIWQALEKGRTAEELVKALTSEYDVTPEKAATDVDAFLSDLRKAQILDD